MQRLRGIFAAALSVTLARVPLMGAPTATVLGTVVTAERAHVGDGIASIGTTVFGGDRLSTEDQGQRPNSRRSSEVAVAPARAARW